MQKLRLENNGLALEVIPECGGKIYTLVSKRTGRQWLWHNPNLGLGVPRYGQSYVEYLDSGGWDEIFPSVAPCGAVPAGDKKLQIPDHGDLVGLAAGWERPDSQTLVTRTQGRCCDFEFTRRIRLCGNALQLRYQVTNTGTYLFPFLWSAHPLIQFEAGMRIELECSIPFTVEKAFGGTSFRAGDVFRWAGSDGPKKMFLPGDAEFQPFAMKFFSEADSVRAVTVLSADGHESLKFSWASPIIRHLGIWMNMGGWCGLGKPGSFSLGIEPTTTAFDALDRAISKNQAILLEPGETREWSMEIAVCPCSKSAKPSLRRYSQQILK